MIIDVQNNKEREGRVYILLWLHRNSQYIDMIGIFEVGSPKIWVVGFCGILGQKRL
jgi:hypothetical protein